MRPPRLVLCLASAILLAHAGQLLAQEAQSVAFRGVVHSLKLEWIAIGRQEAVSLNGFKCLGKNTLAIIDSRLSSLR